MLDDTSQIIRTELALNERLLWSGRPRPGIMLRAADIFYIPFSLLWGGLAIFWEASVVIGKAPFFFALWGIPFVLFGLYLIFGRFLVGVWQRSKTYYGLSDERAIIVSGLVSKSVKSINLKTLGEVSINQKADGSGTITFGPTNMMALRYSLMPWPGTERYQVPSFEMIPDVKRVYGLIQSVQRGR